MNLFFYMARAIMILMRGKDITWAIGRVGLKVLPVLDTNRTCEGPRHIINRFINSYFAFFSSNC